MRVCSTRRGRKGINTAIFPDQTKHLPSLLFPFPQHPGSSKASHHSTTHTHTDPHPHRSTLTHPPTSTHIHPHPYPYPHPATSTLIHLYPPTPAHTHTHPYTPIHSHTRCHTYAAPCSHPQQHPQTLQPHQVASAPTALCHLHHPTQWLPVNNREVIPVNNRVFDPHHMRPGQSLLLFVVGPPQPKIHQSDKVRLKEPRQTLGINQIVLIDQAGTARRQSGHLPLEDQVTGMGHARPAQALLVLLGAAS